MEQAVQQAAVPQMPLGMLDEPLRRLLHRGRKPPPEKRAVGDFERVPRGRRRKKGRGSRATRSRSLPLFRSNRRQSAGRDPASVVLPHCRGPRMARQGNAARYSAKRGSQARFVPCRIKPWVLKCKVFVAWLILARQLLSPCFPAWNREWRRRPRIDAGPDRQGSCCFDARCSCRHNARTLGSEGGAHRSWVG